MNGVGIGSARRTFEDALQAKPIAVRGHFVAQATGKGGKRRQFFTQHLTKLVALGGYVRPISIGGFQHVEMGASASRLILSLVLLAFAASLAPSTRAAERASIQGILISASNEKGQTDHRLASYEPTLRRILRFESYRFLGDDNTSVGVAEKGHLSLGEGHELEIETESSDGKTVHLRVRWLKGGRALMNTGLTLRPGVPAVLGGPSTGNKSEVYAVILIGR